MDYETQIYLDKLIEAVDSPDWWAISITVVNALIMVWLGWRQYKLQKQQTYAQEYETYKNFYLLIRNANIEIDNFLDNILMAMWEPHYTNDKDYLKRKHIQIDAIYKELNKNIVDYELKLSNNLVDVNGYLYLLSTMSRLYQYFDKAMEHDNVKMDTGSRSISYEHDKRDEALMTDIIQHFKYPMLKDAYKSYLSDFIYYKNKTRCDSNILDKIKDKCKIE